ncbi:MAG: L-threonine 3-dehydrogenase [Chlamydiales bacterium]|nr:L-threonine 3-dehydrogenase [Chlamydiales bacterium]MCH9620471.1 L-threonine 3-dehydrogenase [Chlamydiales bacterium]MCH9623457.1 L-threonine 3-dehydrogenase [Chlamydiales bacterium]
MKAIVLHEFKGLEKTYIQELPTPSPKPHEVQIYVHYAGMNPVDWKIADGLLRERFDYQFPITLGWDVSGVVSAVGSDVTTLKKGEAVYAFCFAGELIHAGSYADYVCFDANLVAPKPSCLSFKKAAPLSLSALTAWQVIHDKIELKAGEKILIQGGSGGVGTYAIQFAKLLGAYVITTTSTKNKEYVSRFGPDEIIDYTKESPPENLDAVFDTVGRKVLDQSYSLVKPGGRLWTIAGEAKPTQSIKTGWHMVESNGKQLREISKLIEESKLKLPDIEVIPFEEYETALHMSREGHVRGKLVLEVNRSSD